MFRIDWHSAAAVAALFVSCICSQSASGQEFARQHVIAKMRPYDGPTIRGVDATTLHGKVMCGYQGWFTAKGDGSSKGWFHYARNGKFRPGHCSIDLWPDMRELSDKEKYATPFRHKDGSVAHVFSSHNRATVLRHFRWMKEYGIDGVFVQRFVVQTYAARDLHHCNVVLQHCREGANRHGRVYAVMYDLSGMGQGGMRRVTADWKLLVDRMKIGRDNRDSAYLHHRGKPVVAVWGIGFNDGRKYSLADCEKLVDFFKHDKKYGGNTVMVGVPSYWRILKRDAVRDERLHRIIAKADIVSPWSVGRYATAADVQRFAGDVWKLDIGWCRTHKTDYLPVVFPGFSWHNMRPKSPLNQIPRRKGRFLWSQFIATKRAGAKMIYVAMFDEMDEGTGIFKCTNNPPAGKSRFVTLDGMPTDHYLWLTGMGRRLIRGEISATGEMPMRQMRSCCSTSR